MTNWKKSFSFKDFSHLFFPQCYGNLKSAFEIYSGFVSGCARTMLHNDNFISVLMKPSFNMKRTLNSDLRIYFWEHRSQTYIRDVCSNYAEDANTSR